MRSSPTTVNLAQGRSAPNRTVAAPPAAVATSSTAPPKTKGGKVQAKQANFKNCSDGQKADLDEALTKAAQIAAGAGLALAITPEAKRSVVPRYKTWFGAYTVSRYATVQTHFDKIQDALANQQITFNCDCTDSNLYAYVYPDQPYEIYLCPAFWTALFEGTDSRSGTLVHESSHFYIVASTDDHAYGQSSCKSLANTNPDDATGNADSHEYFAENNPAQEMGIGAALFGLLLVLTLIVGYRLRMRPQPNSKPTHGTGGSFARPPVHSHKGGCRPMDVFFRFLACLALAACLAVPPSTKAEVKLRTTLTAQPSYKVGGPVQPRVQARKPVRRDSLGARLGHAPRGQRGDVFHVSRDGARLYYKGPMVKRSDPGAGDYQRIEPGKSLASEVDLAKVYDLSVPGQYRAEFVGRLHDVARARESVPRKRDEHRPVEVMGNAVTFHMVRP